MKLYDTEMGVDINVDVASKIWCKIYVITKHERRSFVVQYSIEIIPDVSWAQKRLKFCDELRSEWY